MKSVALIIITVFLIVLFTNSGFAQGEKPLKLVKTKPGFGPDITEKYAVIVGINDYPDQPLSWCVSDARAIEEILGDYGWTEITVLINGDATREKVINALKDTIAKCGESDAFLFYYSGHGTKDFDIDDDENDGMDEVCVLPKESGGVALITDDEIDSILTQCKAGVVVAILDSCFGDEEVETTTAIRARRYKGGYSGAKPLSLKRKEDDFGFIGDASLPENQIIITASKATEISGEMDSIQHGVFSYFLKAALTPLGASSTDVNGDNLLSFDEIFRYCEDKVSTLTDGRQNPTIYGNTDICSKGIFSINQDDTAYTEVEDAKQEQRKDFEELLYGWVGMMEAAGQSSEPKFNLNVYTSKFQYNPGDRLELTISVDDDCYLYLVNIYYGGEVALLFPNGNIRDNFVQANSDLTMEEISGGYCLEIMPDSAGGTEYLLVIASPIKLPIEDLLGEKLTQEYVFGEFNNRYGTTGILASIADSVYDGCKPLQLVRTEDSETVSKVSNLTSSRSLAAKVLKYKMGQGSGGE